MKLKKYMYIYLVNLGVETHLLANSTSELSHVWLIVMKHLLGSKCQWEQVAVALDSVAAVMARRTIAWDGVSQNSEKKVTNRCLNSQF